MVPETERYRDENFFSYEKNNVCFEKNAASFFRNDILFGVYKPRNPPLLERFSAHRHSCRAVQPQLSQGAQHQPPGGSWQDTHGTPVPERRDRARPTQYATSFPFFLTPTSPPPPAHTPWNPKPFFQKQHLVFKTNILFPFSRFFLRHPHCGSSF